MVSLHEIFRYVDVRRLNLIRLVSYGLTLQGPFFLAKDIIICVHIIKRYRAVYHINVGYIGLFQISEVGLALFLDKKYMSS